MEFFSGGYRPKVSNRIMSLTENQLKGMAINRLETILKVLKNGVKGFYLFAGHRCCEHCCQYVGNDWEKDVVIPSKPYRDKQSLVQRILNEKHRE